MIQDTQVIQEIELHVFKENLYQRMSNIEEIMNKLKNHHDLKRAQYGGLQNTKFKAYLADIALNVMARIYKNLCSRSSLFLGPN